MDDRALDDRAQQAPRFAIVTPSYYLDFEHCRWLCESVARYVPESVTHYLVVDRADRQIFSQLASSRTRVLYKEDVLGGRLRQLPFARRWWVWPRGMPIRGWIVQQLTKLFMHEVASEDAFVFVDSGAFFVRKYLPDATVKGGKIPLFCEHKDFFKTWEPTRTWHRIGARLLGIKPQRDNDVGYVKTLVTWRRDNLQKMHAHLERVAGRSSFDVLARQLRLSEYYLYGMYCDLILGARSGHYHTATIETVSHWQLGTLGAAELRRLRSQLGPEHLLVMINEKSRTSLEAVREAFVDT
jgi:hypothetical protein